MKLSSQRPKTTMRGVLVSRFKTAAPALAAALIALGTISVASAATNSGSQLSVNSLRTDALVGPIGIGDLTPNLSWIDTASINGAVQSAYQIQAASSVAALSSGSLLWDSGQVQTSAQNAQYAGGALASRSAVAWQVRVWDANGVVSAWSAPATFQIGLTKQSDWTASWITNPNWTSTSSASAMPLLAKQFTTNSGIVSAMLYVSGIGIVSPSVNGTNLGTAVLGPGYSTLSAHVTYSEYDVTSLLQAGSSNVVGLELGLGNRFVQPQSSAQGNRYVSGGGTTTTANGLPRAIAQLEITYSDGSMATVATDGTWQTTLGPTTVSAWWGGESYDARLEVPGWNVPGTNRASWSSAVVTTAPFTSTQLTPQVSPPLQVVQMIPGTDMGSPGTGTELYNFGVNAAGWEQFTITAPIGTTLTFTPAELLQNGQAYQDVNTTGVPVFDQFTSNGKTQTFSPHLSYHGFQWIQISGITAGVTITSPTMLVIRAGNAVAGGFQSSDSTLNAVHNLVDRAVQSNMYSVMTDCPSREKGGWDEETHLLFPMIARHFDVDAYGSSLVQNMADAQLSSGLVPDLVPETIAMSGPYHDDVNWGSSMIMTPWAIYQNYGDTALLASYYPNMTAYMNFLQTAHGTNNLVYYGSNGLGDWGETSVTSTTTPIDLVENWGYYRDEAAMANIAQALGKSGDAQQYSANAAATLAAFTAAYYNPTAQTVANGTQSALAMALDIGAIPPAGVTAVTQALVSAINAHGGFAVGEIGLPPLFRVLGAAGFNQLVYDAVTANQIGGYGYFVNQGLTSLPEYWNVGSGSRNHWMLGAVDNWITGNIGGIQQAPNSVDFKNVVIQPAIVRDMASATSSLQTNHGVIQSAWTNGSGGFSLTATIPVGSTGTINFPATATLPTTPAGATYVGTVSGAAQYTVGAGTYTFASASMATVPNTPPLGAIVCAVDYGTCTVPAGSIANVWYGVGNTWVEIPSISGSFTCLNSALGVSDPAPGVQKSCVIFIAPPSSATFCAVDYGTCTVPPGMVAAVWYGVNHVWHVTANVTGSFTCLYTTFGISDPASGTQKSCELVIAPTNVSQTITFNTIPNQASYFPVLLTATASSGLPVSYVSSTASVCSISGTSATILAAGICTITASQAGNGTYNAAVSVSQSFTIAFASTAAVPVNLASISNVSAIANNGSVPYNGGFDAVSYAYSANLAGTEITALGVPFNLGAPGVQDAVSNTTIPLPGGSYTSLNLLAAAGQGNQPNQSFVLNYTDGTSSTFLQGVSDWASPQGYGNETVALKMANRVTPGGTLDSSQPYYIFGYTIPIPIGKTVASLQLPQSRNVVVLAVTMAPLTAAMPVASPAAGGYATAQTVTLTDATTGASIFYTVNGPAPTNAATAYTAPLTVSSTQTVGAVATAPGYANSPVAYLAYAINPFAPTPTFSLAAGTYTGSQSVSLSDSIPGAKIYYTTNGTTPTTGSTLYAGPIAVTASATLSAIAAASNYTNSQVVQATYIIMQAQTLTFARIAAQTAGVNLTLNATASSGLAVVFASSTTSVCTVSGSTATLVAAGTCTITAMQAGNGSYASATPVAQSFFVAAAAPTPVALSSVANIWAIANNGSIPYNGGFDGSSYAFSATLSGSSITAQGVPYQLGAAGVADALSNVTVPLPAGSYTSLNFLGSGAFGNQPSNNFVVTYTDGTTSTFAQGISDWGAPQKYAGETIASSMAYRVTPGGGTQNGPWYIFAYSIPLNSAKTVKSFTLPNSRNVVVFAVTLLGPNSITFPSIASQTVGVPLTLGATANSGLSVSYASSTTSVCTVSSNTATMVAPGTCTITASQAGNSTYAAATPVSQSFAVIAPQTITFNAIPTQAAGGTLALGATASSGLSVSYASSTTSVCTVSASTATMVAAGTCTITASQAGNSSYLAAAPVAQSFSVATAVNLTSMANIWAIGTNGTNPTNAGFDGSSYAFSGTLLGPSVTALGVPFQFGKAGVADAVSNVTVALPSGSYKLLNFLASGASGNQPSNTFAVTYTDGTTTSVTQGISDWGAPQKYPGETIASSQTYRITPNGTTQNGPWYVFAYSIPLNTAKTVKSITLPNSRNVVVFAITLN